MLTELGQLNIKDRFRFRGGNPVNTYIVIGKYVSINDCRVQAKLERTNYVYDNAGIHEVITLGRKQCLRKQRREERAKKEIK